MTRTAISPRFAIRILFSTGGNLGLMDRVNANQHGNWRVRAVPETGSTNADLVAEGLEGAPDRTVLRADFQTAGRGRLDRSWEAPPGANLLVSFLFRPVPQDASGTPNPWALIRAVALAVLGVAEERCGVVASLKWPNDILIDDVKAGGILAQSGSTPSSAGSPSEFVVVGLGLNVRWSPPGATSLSAHGWHTGIDPHEFCLAMLPRIDASLALSDEEQFAGYIAHVSTIGANVRVELPDGRVVTGRAVDIGSDGRLVVLDECAITHRFDTGDIIHLRTHGG